MQGDLGRALDQMLAFLRMTAIELRRIAERAPDIAGALGYIADQLDAEADGLEQLI